MSFVVNVVVTPITRSTAMSAAEIINSFLVLILPMIIESESHITAVAGSRYLGISIGLNLSERAIGSMTVAR